ncbi:MAG: hypothetical protein ACE366_17920 [Bradymonadia bacterium]
MPKRVFVLRKGGSDSVELEWKGIWKNIQVRYNGDTLGVIENQKALKEGRAFTLPDGRPLEIRLKTGMQTELQVSVSGRALPGSGGDPETKLKLAAGIIYFLGAIAIILGLVAELGKVGLLLDLGLGWISAGAGVIFLGLGYGTQKRSQAALAVACALVLLDTALMIWAYAMTQRGIGGVAMRVFFLISMFQGFGAIKALKNQTGLEGAADEF